VKKLTRAHTQSAEKQKDRGYNAESGQSRPLRKAGSLSSLLLFLQVSHIVTGLCEIRAPSTDEFLSMWSIEFPRWFVSNAKMRWLSGEVSSRLRSSTWNDAAVARR
jgi:hypothetical protein